MNISVLTPEKKKYFGIALIVGITFFTILLFEIGAFSKIELIAEDLLFRTRGKQPPSDKILLVTIDQKSVTDLNRKVSQWPRSYLARVIGNLAEAGAELIALDLDLSRPGFSEEGEDRILAQTLEKANNVIIARFISQGNTVKPLEMFRQAEIGEGFINNLLDQDNVLRRVPLVTIEADEKGENLIPNLSFSLEIARQYLYPENPPELDLNNPDYLGLGDLDIPYPQGKMRINYRGPKGTYRHISYGDIYKGDFDRGAVKGKIVLIGNTHPDFHDFFFTPFLDEASNSSLQVKEMIRDVGLGVSGLEIHANALQTILEKKFIRETKKNEIVLAIAIFGLISGMIFIFSNVKTAEGFLVYLLLSGTVILLSYFLWVKFLWLGGLVPVEGVLTFSYIGGVAFQRFLALKEKAQVTQTFGHYVSYQVVRELLKNPELVTLGGEKKELTVLFSDIRGFTTISEMLPPEAVVKYLNEYLTVMTAIVFKYNGVLDKYMGDGIMAFYGAPMANADHAKMACLTALEMVSALNDLQKKWQAENMPPLNIGIGINTGPMIVGNMGSDVRFDYTVIGDSVNLGARLESINKEYGTNIIVSESARKLAGDDLLFRELDLVKVKGKNIPIKIFELAADSRGENAPEYLHVFTQGLAAYRAQNWSEAEEIFDKVLTMRDDPPAKLFKGRVRELAAHPPSSDWDGVYVAKSK